MGTRADFYIQKEDKLIWLGSVAYDGYPVDEYSNGIPLSILEAKTEEKYIENLSEFLFEDDFATFPDQGWPWPWKNSNTTDYSYIFNNGKVLASCFGYTLFDPLLPEAEDKDEEEANIEKTINFPDMTDIQNVTYGKRSGCLFIGFPNAS